MIHAPVQGSVLNKPATLYKSLTKDKVATINDAIIAYQNNYYRAVSTIRWVDVTERQDSESQPIEGAMVSESYLTIKTSGEFRPTKKMISPEKSDLLMLDGELWVIDDLQRARIKSLMNHAVLYLSLRKAL